MFLPDFSFYDSCVWLFLLSHCVTSTTSAFQTRKSTLHSWKDDVEIGSILERRSSGLHEVLIESSNGKAPISVSLPYFEQAGSVGSSIWPSSLAGSILLRYSSGLHNLIEGKEILELGSGLGLGGLIAAQDASRCVLTDSDQELVEQLGKCVADNGLSEKAGARKLDWRDVDPHGQDDDKYDICLGFDVAYYFHLVGPFVATACLKLKERNSVMLVLGQSYRECQWRLYHHLRDGGYNQFTDQHEQPWTGSTKMLLYKLKMERWLDGDDSGTGVKDPSKIDGVFPIAALLYTTKDLDVPELTPHDYVATQEDEDSLEKSF